MNPSTRVTISKYVTYICLGVSLYSVKEIGGTLGYDKPRATFFLILSTMLGLVAAVYWIYYKSLMKNKALDAIAVETLSKIGSRKVELPK